MRVFRANMLEVKDHIICDACSSGQGSVIWSDNGIYGMLFLSAVPAYVRSNIIYHKPSEISMGPLWCHQEKQQMSSSPGTTRSWPKDLKGIEELKRLLNTVLIHSPWRHFQSPNRLFCLTFGIFNMTTIKVSFRECFFVLLLGRIDRLSWLIALILFSTRPRALTQRWMNAHVSATVQKRNNKDWC